MAELFDVDRSVITKHLQNIFDSKELAEVSVSAKFAHTAEDGKMYQTQFYNLDAIISVGSRVNSTKATQKIESDFDKFSKKLLRQRENDG